MNYTRDFNIFNLHKFSVSVRMLSLQCWEKSRKLGVEDKMQPSSYPLCYLTTGPESLHDILPR